MFKIDDIVFDYDVTDEDKENYILAAFNNLEEAEYEYGTKGLEETFIKMSEEWDHTSDSFENYLYDNCDITIIEEEPEDQYPGFSSQHDLDVYLGRR